MSCQFCGLLPDPPRMPCKDVMQAYSCPLAAGKDLPLKELPAGSERLRKIGNSLRVERNGREVSLVWECEDDAAADRLMGTMLRKLAEGTFMVAIRGQVSGITEIDPDTKEPIG